MEKPIFTLIAASVLFISVAHFGIATTGATSLQQQSLDKATNISEKSITNPPVISSGGPSAGNKDNSVRQAGAIATQIIVLEPNARVLKLHIGDQLTARAKLIRTDTGAGIPAATISAQASLDGQSWISAPRQYCLTTNAKGEVSYAGTIPDPHNYLPSVRLPMTGYVKVTYVGDSTYAGSESVVYEATLLP